MMKVSIFSKFDIASESILQDCSCYSSRLGGKKEKKPIFKHLQLTHPSDYPFHRIIPIHLFPQKYFYSIYGRALLVCFGEVEREK